VTTTLDTWSVEDSRRRATKRWSRFPADVLDLTVAEMDLPTAVPVLAAVRDAVEREAFGYPLTEEYTDFQPVVAEWLGGQGLDIDEHAIFMLSDVMKGMSLALEHLVEPHTPVAVVTPTYSAFFDALFVARRRALETPMQQHADGSYQLDLSAIRDAFAAGARSLLLCNPSNPTGAVYPRVDLEALAELAGQFTARIITDEVHAPLRFTSKPHVPYAAVDPDRAITLTSASKSWNIPGLRCAVIAFSNPADIPVWQALPGGAKGGISPLGIVATIAAFQKGEPWLAAVRQSLGRRRDLAVAGLNNLGHGRLITAPEATYLGWVDLRRFELADAANHLRLAAGLAVTPGEEHGAVGRGFVRINLATPETQLGDMVDRFGRALQAVPPADSLAG
jgi:cystathionine beta-lyase